MRLPWPRLLTDERGLTLAEILVALLVIGVGLVGIAVVVPVSSYGVQEGNQLSTATFLAEQMIERTRSVTWTEIPATDCLGLSAGDAAPTTTTCPGTPGTVQTFSDEPSVAGVAGNLPYRRTVRIEGCTVTACAGITHAAVRQVTVTVTYRGLSAAGQAASDKTVRLQWLVARK
jgi:prepilin-type N-terminal cleavage/methylation domain-containing protein